MGPRVVLRQVCFGRSGADTDARGRDIALRLPRQSAPLRGSFETVSVQTAINQSRGSLVRRRFTRSIMLELIYGHTVTSPDDKYLQIAEGALKGSTDVAGACIDVVEMVPSRKWYSPDVLGDCDVWIRQCAICRIGSGDGESSS